MHRISATVVIIKELWGTEEGQVGKATQKVGFEFSPFICRHKKIRVVVGSKGNCSVTDTCEEETPTVARATTVAFTTLEDDWTGQLW